MNTSRAAPKTYEELLTFQGRQFVVHSYWLLLGREPDPVGLQHYLTRLGKGERKQEIVMGIRYSREGKAMAPAVPGLRLGLIKQRFFLLPLLGPVMRAVAIVLRLPGLERKQRVLECQHALQMEEVYRNLATLRELSTLSDVERALYKQLLVSLGRHGRSLRA